MTLQFELWHLITISLSIVGGFWAMAKVIGSQNQRYLDERFESQESMRLSYHQQVSERLVRIEAASREESARWLQVERELHKLQIELPREYVRREDYVMAVASIMAKLDRISMKFENLILRGAKNYE